MKKPGIKCQNKAVIDEALEKDLIEIHYVMFHQDLTTNHEGGPELFDNYHIY